MEDYYQKQLLKLNGNVKVKFTSDSGATYWMDLNDTCCKAVAKLLLKTTKDKQIII